MTAPLVLGIESSCDETGVGLVRGHDLLADAVASSVDEHARFGGVVPEVASRAHLEAMVPVVRRALGAAGVGLGQVDAIAVTAGPGLAGALLVGVCAAKAYAVAFPRSKYRDGTSDFSFSGLKTAVARWVEARQAAGLPVLVPDVAASFQEAVADVLTRKAVDACLAHGGDHLVISGGVAANSRLRTLAAQRCEAAGIRLRVPRPALCTDNGAMVAALGADLVAAGAEPSGAGLAADSGLPVTQVLAA